MYVIKDYIMQGISYLRFGRLTGLPKRVIVEDFERYEEAFKVMVKEEPFKQMFFNINYWESQYKDDDMSEYNRSIHDLLDTYIKFENLAVTIHNTELKGKIPLK